jgi:amino acid adenylation domain-containing protein
MKEDKKKLTIEKYWLRRLSGHLSRFSLPLLPLPEKEKTGKNARAARQTASYHFEIPPPSTEKLKKISDGSDKALFILFLSGLNILLYKYTGVKDLVIGTVPPRKEQARGKILFCRNQISGALSFRETLRQTKEVVLEAFNYADYSFGSLYQKLLAQGKTGHPDIFNAAFVYESLQEKGRHLNQFDLVFLLSWQENRLILQVEYIEDLYAVEIIRRFCHNLVYIFDQVTKKPDQRILEICPVCPGEAREILAFNGSTGEYPRETLNRLFEKQADKTPDHVALVGNCQLSTEEVAPRRCLDASGEMHLTYKELDKKSRQLACLLQEKVVQPDTVVAILAERSIEMIIAIMGILKAGGAYLPIDPDYPEERIIYMLKDSASEILVTMQDYSTDSKFDKGILRLCLSASSFSSLSTLASTSTSQVSPGNLAYVLYTSGTTGKPKGVMVPHHNVMAYLNAFAREFEVFPADTVIQQASYSFDAFVEEVYPALFNGAKIVIAQRHEIPDISLLTEIILRHRVTMISCSPLLLNELNKLGGIKSIRTYISGGDVLKAEYIGNLPKTAAIYNTYGPTETTVCATYHRCLPGVESHIPIGKPITNYCVYILDSHHKLLPVGVSGELFISGPGAARGYLNKPELTAESFIRAVISHSSLVIGSSKSSTNDRSSQYPITPLPHSPIYKTGDMARWLADGVIEFKGRKDRQVQLRGFRIEPGEIESCLREYEQVVDAIVIPREDKGGETYLCAYIIPAAAKTNLTGFFNYARLRDFLAKKLPAYMVPAHFVKLEQIPLTTHGKIDTEALPEPEVGYDAIPFIPGEMLDKAAAGPEMRVEAAGEPAPGTFSCYIIGETTLPVRCVEILLEQGCRVLGMISNDPQVINWAKSIGIPTIPPRKTRMISFLEENPFDYLFGIFNTFVLPEDILSLPGKCAINYHDSLLPRYAGMHVPSWAIINRETQHGVTWHVVDKGIDTGDILKQVPIEIAPGDTGFSLNMKCYHAGVKAFEELVKELVSGGETRVRQDFDQRTYYGKYKRPASGGLVSFNQAAEDIDALVRALNFAGYENPLGMLRMAVENEFFILPGISVLNSTGNVDTGSGSPLPPGSLVRIGKESLTVSTRTRDIEIRKILTINGQEMTAADFVKKFALVQGWCFREMDVERAERIDAYNSIICRHENFWKRRLSRLQPLRLVTRISKDSDERRRIFSKRKFPLPGQMQTQILNQGLSRGDFLLAAFAAYLLQLTGISSFDIAYSDSSLQQNVKESEGLFARQVPLHVESDAEQTFDTFCKLIKKELHRLRKHHTYIRDIFPRYPELEEKAEPTFALGMMLVKNPEDFEPVDIQQLCLVVGQEGNECMLLYNGMVLDKASIDSLARDFYIFLEKVLAAPYSVIDHPISPLQKLKIKARIHRPVKIEGTIIDEVEIEECLGGYLDIKEAVVVSKSDKKGGRMLVAYLVSEIELKESNLRTYLSENLLFPLPPIHYLQLEKMPLTSGNKNVHRELLEKLDINIGDRQEHSPPADEIEAKLAGIWSGLLGMEKALIGTNSDFFQLGGHSLKATVLSSQIHKEMNVKVPIMHIFNHPTIKELAEYIKGAEANRFLSIQPVEEREYYPVSSAQKRMYVASRFKGQDISDNATDVLLVEGDLEPLRFESVMKQIVNRHQSLRTSFKIIDDQLVQKVHAPGDVELLVEYDDSFDSRPIDIYDFLDDFIRPFDLGKAPLMRIALIKLTNCRHLVVIDVHHIIWDGGSKVAMMRELEDLYQNRQLPGLRLQYRDFSSWQNRVLKSDIIKKQEQYWAGVFAGEIPVLHLPTDYPRPRVQSFAGDSVGIDLGLQLCEKVDRLVRETGATHFMVLLSVFYILLSRCSGQEDIIVGSPIVGRPHSDLENIVGMFVNMLALRNFPGKEKKYIEFLEEVKKSCSSAYENQDYQFDDLVEKLGIQRDPTRSALFDVVFAHHNRDVGLTPGSQAQGKNIRKVTFKSYRYKEKKAQFDIVFYVYVGGGITLDFRYSKKLFKPSTAERMLNRYIEILQQVTENPGIRLKEIDISFDLLAVQSKAVDQVEFGF